MGAPRRPGLERVADHVVGVVEQPLSCVAGGMHEEDDVELLHFREEAVQGQPAIGEVHAVDAAVDLHRACRAF